MNGLVLEKAGVFSEPLSTIRNFAHVRSFAGVCSDMVLQFRRVDERLYAMRTEVRTFTGMFALMNSKNVGGVETFSTAVEGASERFFACMNTDVSFKIKVAFKHFFTIVTRNNFLVIDHRQRRTFGGFE